MQPPETTWTDVDIEEESGYGWWVVVLGVNPDGSQEKQHRKLFRHSKIDRGLARWSAHLLAWHIASKEGVRYLA